MAVNKSLYIVGETVEFKCFYKKELIFPEIMVQNFMF